MNKNIFRFFIFSAVIILVNGCSSSGVSVRSYVEDRARVDQDVGGNTGYYSGEAREIIETPQRKKTRKIYVVEISKEAAIKKEKSALSLKTNDQSEKTINDVMEKDDHANEVVFPDEMGVKENSKSVVEYIEYTVEKDDTLQKVAKKVYGSYGKWIKIYEYNKPNIKDPDHIQPGTILKIPQN